ncbi:hypothetical protein PSFL_07360 [Pseudomonas sp. DD1]|uniref:hypothetical protein n=1 Tax=Pseudomonas sp. DD1 TaxID=879558 RepID=UPI0037C89D81
MSEVKRFKIEFQPEGAFHECVYAADFDRVTAERDALQALLTAADERADVLEGLVGEVLDAVGREPLDLDAVLRLRARMRAALKPVEGRGDEK